MLAPVTRGVKGAIFCLAALSTSACDRRKPSPLAADTLEIETPSSTGFVAPLPPRPRIDPGRRALGKRLFADTALSGDGRVSCSSCHDATKGFTDGASRSNGPGRAPGLNTPTLLNVASFYSYNWNGKFATLEEHHDALIKNPRVMATTWPDIVARLRANPSYAEAFAGAYAEGITARTVRDALISYERSLTTPNARFDRFLRGDDDAIDATEKRGFQLFKSYGCISCHQGKNVGGNLYQRLGILRDYFADRGGVTEDDYGRFNVTKRPEDRFVFRVPSLRNVALTAPYLHDGTAPTLEAAIGIMARYQLGRSLPHDDVEAIVAFLKTLTGELEEETP